MLVEFQPGTFTDQFTIEAWVRAEWFTPDYEYTLFDAGRPLCFARITGSGSWVSALCDPIAKVAVRLGQNAGGFCSLAPPLFPSEIARMSRSPLRTSLSLMLARALCRKGSLSMLTARR